MVKIIFYLIKYSIIYYNHFFTFYILISNYCISHMTRYSKYLFEQITLVKVRNKNYILIKINILYYLKYMYEYKETPFLCIL